MMNAYKANGETHRYNITKRALDAYYNGKGNPSCAEKGQYVNEMGRKFLEQVISWSGASDAPRLQGLYDYERFGMHGSDWYKLSKEEKQYKLEQREAAGKRNGWLD